MIDQILERALNRKGLIDWHWIDAELLKKSATVNRQILYKRAKALLATRAKQRWLYRDGSAKR
jgi:hypothetical protein